MADNSNHSVSLQCLWHDRGTFRGLGTRQLLLPAPYGKKERKKERKKKRKKERKKDKATLISTLLLIIIIIIIIKYIYIAQDREKLQMRWTRWIMSDVIQ